MKIIKTKIFRVLIVSFIFGIILGIISFILSDKKIISTDIINYINLVENGKFNYSLGLINSIFSNLKFSFFIWIFGILFILSFLCIILIIFKGISLGFVFSSIIYVYKLKGALYAFVLSLNAIFNIFIFIFLSYYSIRFSIKSFNAWRNNRQINYKSFFINYTYIYIILLFILILSSLFEIYISSNIIKFVV